MNSVSFPHTRWETIIPSLVTKCFKYLPVSKKLSPGFHKSVSIAFIHERKDKVLLKIMELLEIKKLSLEKPIYIVNHYSWEGNQKTWKPLQTHFKPHLAGLCHWLQSSHLFYVSVCLFRSALVMFLRTELTLRQLYQLQYTFAFPRLFPTGNLQSTDFCIAWTCKDKEGV